MCWYKHMILDIHQQLCLLKNFKMVLAGHLTDTLPGKGSKILLHHQDCPVHILSLHPLCICLDCLHPYLCFFWKEDKNLDDTNTLLPTFNMITYMWIWNQYHVTVVLLLQGLSCSHFFLNQSWAIQYHCKFVSFSIFQTLMSLALKQEKIVFWLISATSRIKNR
jgi:hypothetical protein